jgi:arginine-tRNA-protein transferase
MLENDFLFLDEISFINEEFYTFETSPHQMDFLLENGWRHFGTQFFRYNFGFYRNEIRRVFPLRIKLSDFSISKSQRRILRKNQDLRTVIRPIEINAEKEDLFERHKVRFDHGIPGSIYDFLSFSPSNVPCEAWEICIYDKNKLLAASFFDVSGNSTSGIYAMFTPEEKHRSLGILTMLYEIEFSIQNNKTFYYQGYVYEGESFYDYKKRFSAIEKFDWQGNWTKFDKKSQPETEE